MSYIRTPTAKVEIGGQSLTAAEAGLARLEVTLALGAHGGAELVLWPGSRFAGAGTGDPVVITFTDASAGGGVLGAALGALGGGGEAPVLTGSVEAVRVADGQTSIEVLDATAALSRTYLSRSYLDLDVAGIVEDLAADVAIDEVEADTPLEYYAVENRSSAWAHLLRLADLAGCDLSAGPDGGLRFRPVGRGDSHEIRFGAELIAYDFGQAEAGTPRQVAPHGAASEAGNWHWPLADPLGAEPGPARIVGGITNREAADQATAAAAFRADAARVRGQVTTLGNAAIRPGDSVTLVDVPGGVDEALRVRQIRHRLDGRSGFISVMEVEAGGGAGAFDALGALAGGIGL